MRNPVFPPVKQIQFYQNCCILENGVWKPGDFLNFWCLPNSIKILQYAETLFRCNKLYTTKKRCLEVHWRCIRKRTFVVCCWHVPKIDATSSIKLIWHQLSYKCCRNSIRHRVVNIWRYYYSTWCIINRATLISSSLLAFLILERLLLFL